MVYDPDSCLFILLLAVICSFNDIPTVQLYYSVFMTYTRKSQMKTLKSAIKIRTTARLSCKLQQ